MGPVEVITGIQRRQRWTAEQKKAVVPEIEQPGMSVPVVARKCEVHPNQLFRWRRLFREGALTAARAEEQLVPASEVRELRKQIREWERLLCRKTMGVDILRDAVRIAREKNRSRMRHRSRRATLMGSTRSNSPRLSISSKSAVSTGGLLEQKRF